MTIEAIQTFLAVQETRNLSLAARQLFVSQSTVSHRIQLLEAELGVPLFSRKKGQRTIDITSSGEEFIPIAHQWLSLLQDTGALRERTQRRLLTIGSIDLIHSYTLAPLYRRYVEEKKNVRLSIRTHHSTELHSLLLNHDIDIGYVFSQMPHPDIISTPVYRETMALMCHEDSPYMDEMELSSLPADQSILLHWGPDFEHWYARHWNPNQSLLTVNTGSLLANYLSRPGRWTIAPISLCQALSQKGTIACYRLSDPPPSRICYQITFRHSNSGKKGLIEQFSRDLRSHVQELGILSPCEA